MLDELARRRRRDVDCGTPRRAVVRACLPRDLPLDAAPSTVACGDDDLTRSQASCFSALATPQGQNAHTTSPGCRAHRLLSVGGATGADASDVRRLRDLGGRLASPARRTWLDHSGRRSATQLASRNATASSAGAASAGQLADAATSTNRAEVLEPAADPSSRAHIAAWCCNARQASHNHAFRGVDAELDAAAAALASLSGASSPSSPSPSGCAVLQ